jgi:hypothetical protein
MMSASAPGSIPLMERSGQTDAERRRLRQQQRHLQKRIRSNAEDMENPSLHIFSKIREENNTLFAKVAYTREAVLDGESLQMISEHAAKHGRDDVNVPRYNAMRVSQNLVKKFRRLYKFDWHSFGVQAGTCFNATPSRVQFLAGPLHADYVPKKARAKRKRDVYEDNEPEERPDVVTNLQENADASHSAVERHIKVLNKVLKHRSEQVMQHVADKKRLKQGDCEVDAIQYMFNPHSFTQTVENLFHFSFLIKNGNAKICARPDGPKVASISRSIKKEPRQAIVAITPRDWRDLCRANKVVQADIPHRTVSKQVRLAREPPAVNLETTRIASVETNHEKYVETSYPSSNLKTGAFRNEEYAKQNRDESVASSDPSSNLKTSEFINEEDSDRNDDESPRSNTTGPGGTYEKPGDYLVEETNPPGYPNDVRNQARSPSGDAAHSNAFTMFAGGHDENTDFVDVCTPTGSPTKAAPTGSPTESPVVVTPESTQEPTTASPAFFLTENCVNTTIDFDTLAADDSPFVGGEFVEDEYLSASDGSCGLSGETNNYESTKGTNRDDPLTTNDDETSDNSKSEARQSAETNIGESVETSTEASPALSGIYRHTIINMEKRPGVIARVYLAVWTSVWVWASTWNFRLQYYRTNPAVGNVLGPTDIWLSIATVLIFFVWRLITLMQPLGQGREMTLRRV